MIKKSIVFLAAILLSFSTMVAYAWWDQLQVSLDVIEVEIGSGSRIQLQNLSSANQGVLVPTSSAQAGRNGYTTSYEFLFQLKFTPDLVEFDLALGLENIYIYQEGIPTQYDRTLRQFEALHISIVSSDLRFELSPNSSIEITAFQTLINLPSERVNLPISSFELIVVINESQINEDTLDALGGATLSFDLTAEVTL